MHSEDKAFVAFLSAMLIVVAMGIYVMGFSPVAIEEAKAKAARVTLVTPAKCE